jgi:hypothetical protein
MKDLDKIIDVMADFKKIASLQKVDLESTEDMPNYNSSYTQLLKLKGMFSTQESSQSIAQKIRELLVTTYAEMADELQKMIAPENLKTASVIYDDITKKLELIVVNLDQDATLLSQDIQE